MPAIAESPAIGIEERYLTELPEPTGYRLLIALPEVKETTDSGIYKAPSEVDVERVASIAGFVLAVGPDAYADKKRFPNGAYCQKGDWVLFRSYTGTRLMIHGYELRLINDDSVEARVEDPTGIERA